MIIYTNYEYARDMLPGAVCWPVYGDMVMCGMDYLMVKRHVSTVELSRNAFMFVGEVVPVIDDVGGGDRIMYVGFPQVISSEGVPSGVKVVESRDAYFLYLVSDDDKLFLDFELWMVTRAPISAFGFGLVNLYRELIGLLREKRLYIPDYLY